MPEPRSRAIECRIERLLRANRARKIKCPAELTDPAYQRYRRLKTQLADARRAEERVG